MNILKEPILAIVKANPGITPAGVAIFILKQYGIHASKYAVIQNIQKMTRENMLVRLPKAYCPKCCFSYRGLKLSDEQIVRMRKKKLQLVWKD